MFSNNFFRQIKEIKKFSVKGNRENFIISCKKSPESYLEMFLLESGAILGFNHIRNKKFPDFTLSSEYFPSNMIIINICLKGRVELFFPKKTLFQFQINV